MPSQSASGVGSCRNPALRRTLRHPCSAHGRPLACLDARKPTPAARPQPAWAPRPSARGFPHDVEFPQQGNVTSMWKTTGYGHVTKLWSRLRTTQWFQCGKPCPTVCAWRNSSLEGLTATALIQEQDTKCKTASDEHARPIQAAPMPLGRMELWLAVLASAAVDSRCVARHGRLDAGERMGRRWAWPWSQAWPSEAASRLSEHIEIFDLPPANAPRRRCSMARSRRWWCGALRWLVASVATSRVRSCEWRSTRCSRSIAGAFHWSRGVRDRAWLNREHICRRRSCNRCAVRSLRRRWMFSSHLHAAAARRPRLGCTANACALRALRQSPLYAPIVGAPGLCLRGDLAAGRSCCSSFQRWRRRGCSACTKTSRARQNDACASRQRAP